MKHINLTLLIPNLNQQGISAGFLALGKMPQATKFNTSELSLEHFLVKLFCLDNLEQIPFAAIAALGHGLPMEQGWWLRADPISLRVDATSVFSLGNKNLNLTPLEQVALLKDLNDLLAHDDLKITAASAREWYLHLLKDPEINTYPLSSTIGKDIHAYLPQGGRGSYWRKLLTEIQMLLYNNTVNQQLTEAGKNTIDSLWFWGEGQLPKQQLISNWQQVITNYNFCRGLALLTNTPVVSLPKDFDQWYASLTTPGDYLIVIDNFEEITLECLEQQWFSPMFKAFKQNKLDTIRFFPDYNHYYALKKTWWRKIW